MTKEDYNAQFDPNMWGVFTCAQAAALLWKQHDYKNGRVVFVSCTFTSTLPHFLRLRFSDLAHSYFFAASTLT